MAVRRFRDLPGDRDASDGCLPGLRAFARGSPRNPPPATGWPAVRQGPAGERVRTAQYLPDTHGSAPTVDGPFGSATDSAVRSFRSARGPAAGGIAGSGTWQALVA
ncbi:peptidoglycan-binding domain-containing protein [Streptomyces sp. TG1A-8]|uniref:peptidoglycan-binding domain-containing protein n=1 Tax=Streptomyces sp. TG1A-8 TaxID=3051385 RepID=UPI00265C5365|nr:peptidoglycan-binding domain-containing protein [Streptomyces sp. TG1A-8]MDO0929042.1 peptidoglycan-binding domain-containing protein [Streptomyces sp. TG1A-8]